MSGVATSTIIATAAIAASAIGTGVSAYMQNDASIDQGKAQDKARQDALVAQGQQQDAQGKANQKKPDVSGILAAAQNAAKGGVGGTMLTSPTGGGSALGGQTSLLG